MPSNWTCSFLAWLMEDDLEKVVVIRVTLTPGSNEKGSAGSKYSCHYSIRIRFHWIIGFIGNWIHICIKFPMNHFLYTGNDLVIRPYSQKRQSHPQVVTLHLSPSLSLSISPLPLLSLTLSLFGPFSLTFAPFLSLTPYPWLFFLYLSHSPSSLSLSLSLPLTPLSLPLLSLSPSLSLPLLSLSLSLTLTPSPFLTRPSPIYPSLSFTWIIMEWPSE